MALPDIHTFPESHPGPYERQMGAIIANLLRVFEGRVPDAETHACVLALANCPSCWSAGHAVFDEVRERYLCVNEATDQKRAWQYCLEESCCKALYNATRPPGPFDPSSPFFVVCRAVTLAKCIGAPLDAVEAAISSTTEW